MEPEKVALETGVEKGPVQYERGVEINSPNESQSEKGLEEGAEKKERVSEAAAAIADSGFPTTLPTPVVDDTTQDVTTTIAQNNAQGTPLVANDDDLIEKEWVDKAKKIITETKEDPYSREEAVNKLQKEYQQKRYGGNG